MEIAPIFDMYAMLDHYLPGGLVDQDEMDQKSVLLRDRRGTNSRILAEDVADELGKIQGHYKKKLVLDVREFKQDCADFRSDFEKNGPGAPGCSPEKLWSDSRGIRTSSMLANRKMDMYIAGEELFALRTSKYPDTNVQEKK